MGEGGRRAQTSGYKMNNVSMVTVLNDSVCVFESC